MFTQPWYDLFVQLAIGGTNVRLYISKVMARMHPGYAHGVVQWFPTYFDAFLPLLILELFIPSFLPCSDSTGSLGSINLLTTIGTTVNGLSLLTTIT